MLALVVSFEYMLWQCEMCLAGSRIGVALEIASELVFPDVVFVGSIRHLSLPVCSRSTALVSVMLYVDHATCDGQVCVIDQCPFRIAQQNFLLNPAASQNIQV